MPSPELALALAIRTLPVQSSGLDLELTLTFTNPGPKPITIYPAAARPRAAAGWGSPTLDLLFEAPGLLGREAAALFFRTYAGPPGMPPNMKYFSHGQVALKPGKSHDLRRRACVLAGTSLDPIHLAASTLDPAGMDGLSGKDLACRALVVLEASCQELEAARRGRPDFLRDRFIVPLETEGDWTVRAAYHQEPWVAFEPRASVSARSHDTRLPLPPL